jgi:hypothetical protein
MELLFHRVYEMADLMGRIIGDHDNLFVFDELDWGSPSVSGCLGKFSKTSLLAYLCFAFISIHDLQTARKDPEDMNVEALEGALQN